MCCGVVSGHNSRTCLGRYGDGDSLWAIQFEVELVGSNTEGKRYDVRIGANDSADPLRYARLFLTHLTIDLGSGR